MVVRFLSVLVFVYGYEMGVLMDFLGLAYSFEMHVWMLPRVVIYSYVHIVDSII